MALTIGDNFSYQGAKPLDGRIKYDTLAAMKAMADSTLYDGCLAYCVATDKTYQWKSTNPVDADTGKWREFETGGGTGGGHTIEDPEGTALTQRDTLQFGGDLEVSDDDENEKTVVAPHELTAAELTEIMSTLPGTPTDLPVLFDESGAEYQVGWYRLANGTKKPVYEKSFYSANVGANAREAKIGEILNADRVLYEIGSFVLSSGNKFNIPYIAIGNPNEGVACVLLSNGNVIINNFISLQLLDVIAIIRYTKTTDTPS